MTYAVFQGFLPYHKKDRYINNKETEDKSIFIGIVLIIIGIILGLAAVFSWKENDLGILDPEQMMRIVIPSFLLLIVGVQQICTGFVLGIMKIKTWK